MNDAPRTRMSVLDLPTGLAKFELPDEAPPPSFQPRPRLNSIGNEEIDVASELESAFWTAKRLLEAAEHDEGTPLNQKAQIIGSLNTVLSSITKLRAELYSAERNRLMETALINTLKMHPQLQKAFMADYEISLKSL